MSMDSSQFSRRLPEKPEDILQAILSGTHDNETICRILTDEAKFLSDPENTSMDDMRDIYRVAVTPSVLAAAITNFVKALNNLEGKNLKDLEDEEKKALSKGLEDGFLPYLRSQIWLQDGHNIGTAQSENESGQKTFARSIFTDPPQEVQSHEQKVAFLRDIGRKICALSNALGVNVSKAVRHEIAGDSPGSSLGGNL